MLMSPDLKCHCVFITLVLTSQSGFCVQGMKLISSLRPVTWSDFQIARVTPGNFVELLHQPNLYKFFQPSLREQKPHESSSAPHRVLKLSNVTRERHRHVTVLMLGGCEKASGSGRRSNLEFHLLFSQGASYSSLVFS